MILAIDIGNSNIVIGGYEAERLMFVTEMVTEYRYTADQYAVSIKSLMGLYTEKKPFVEGAIISSVVPELVNVIKAAVIRLFGIKPLVVGPGLKTGLPIAIDNPAQLGADIAACAVAAAATEPLPCVVYDLGTAATVSVIDRAGRLQGVVICAGVGTTLEMLTSRTALLPHVSIEAPKTIIGKNTMHSMQSGLIYGTAAMLDGLALRIERELGEPVNLVATGDMAREIIPHCDRKVKIREHLLLEGLRTIYYRNKRTKL